MNIAYLDCFSGISGDMMLGALLDAGLPLAQLQADLALLELPGWELAAEKVKKRGLAGTHITITLSGPSPERHLADIVGIIRGSGLPEPVQEQAVAVFERLAEAEAAVHGTTPDHVHFHEVGAVDSILDIVGSVAGLYRLGVQQLHCSALPLGGGWIEADHGRLPVPAPATAKLVEGLPTYGGPVEAELVTPTGAALVATLCQGWGAMPPMVSRAVGMGAGTKDLPHPNLLRLVLGEAPEAVATTGEGERLTQLETNIDNMDPQLYEHLIERLLGAGALDVMLIPAVMKKSRPATLVSVLCPPALRDLLLEVIFQETTTLGVRIQQVDRVCLPRAFVTVPTPWGPVKVKYARSAAGALTISPEYEVCRVMAAEHGVPLKAVMEEARRHALEQLGRAEEEG